jgi:hypothetical protein
MYLLFFSTVADRRFSPEIHKPHISGILRLCKKGLALLVSSSLW